MVGQNVRVQGRLRDSSPGRTPLPGLRRKRPRRPSSGRPSNSEARHRERVALHWMQLPSPGRDHQRHPCSFLASDRPDPTLGRPDRDGPVIGLRQMQANVRQPGRHRRSLHLIQRVAEKLRGTQAIDQVPVIGLPGARLAAGPVPAGARPSRLAGGVARGLPGRGPVPAAGPRNARGG